MSARRTLVPGGTGKTGRRVVERLRSRGVPVRVGSRLGEPRFDWEDPATWHDVAANVEAIYVRLGPPQSTRAVRVRGSPRLPV